MAHHDREGRMGGDVDGSDAIVLAPKEQRLPGDYQVWTTQKPICVQRGQTLDGKASGGEANRPAS